MSRQNSSGNFEKILKCIFFVPESHKESVKNALFAVGAGTLGNYTNCSWETKGMGQFKPQKESQPFTGSEGELTRIPEWRVEMLVKKNIKANAIDALRDSHPYEEPAFEFLNLAD